MISRMLYVYNGNVQGNEMFLSSRDSKSKLGLKECNSVQDIVMCVSQGRYVERYGRFVNDGCLFNSFEIRLEKGRRQPKSLTG